MFIIKNDSNFVFAVKLSIILSNQKIKILVAYLKLKTFKVFTLKKWNRMDMNILMESRVS